MNNDTIVALATPIGKGSVGILRVSGNQVKKISLIILNKILKPRYAEYLYFFDKKKNIIDKGISIFFPSPNSFTGEDVLEFHVHGGQIVINILLREILKISNTRIADPGEFSKRAFLNKKIDLIQAESIASIIEANSIQSLKASINSFKGIFSQKINKIIKNIFSIIRYIEYLINFPEETSEIFSQKKFNQSIDLIINELKLILKESKQYKKIQDGIKIVLSGRPNTGKSTIMNGLSTQETSIVTNIPGTTRDIINEYIYINNICVNIIDTAGIRKSSDLIESIGIKKSWDEINNADYLFFVEEINLIINNNIFVFPKYIKKILNKFPKNIPIIIIANKSDLINKKFSISKYKNYIIIALSAKNSNDIYLLKKYMKSIINISNTEGTFLAKERHIYAVKKSFNHLLKIKKISKNNIDIELLSEELNIVYKYLNTIIGKFNSEDIIKEIFSKFCIGK